MPHLPQLDPDIPANERELLQAIDELKARLFGCTDAVQAEELRHAIGERTQQIYHMRRNRQRAFGRNTETGRGIGTSSSS